MNLFPTMITQSDWEDTGIVGETTCGESEEMLIESKNDGKQ